MHPSTRKLQEDIAQQQVIFNAALAKAEPVEFHPDFFKDGKFTTLFHMWLNVSPLMQVGKLYRCTFPNKEQQPMLIVKTETAGIAVMEGFSGLTSESVGFNLIGLPKRMKALGQPSAWPDAAQLKALLG